MRQTLDALLTQLNHPALPNIDLSLARMEALLAALGNPERRLPPVIHIAGTNGKGSTLAFLNAIYRAAGYSVHAYTSPHLVRFNERIQIQNTLIDDECLLKVLERVADVAALNPVTFFEATTAAAFLAFVEHRADVLLLEVGMGGRLDATNVVSNPLASVITPIGMDHMEYLGGTIAKIAAEKAGIIKAGIPCIIGKQSAEAEAVIAKCAAQLNAPLLKVDASLAIPQPSLAGAHQYDNARLAATVAKTLNHHLAITDEHLKQGIRSAYWPARLQTLRHGPLVQAWQGQVVLDGGHNANAAQRLAEWIQQQSQPVTLMVGMMQRKDAGAFFAALAPHINHTICVTIEEAGAYPAEELAAIAAANGIQHTTHETSLDAAVERLSPHTDGVLLVTGSLYFAGQVLKTHA